MAEGRDEKMTERTNFLRGGCMFRAIVEGYIQSYFFFAVQLFSEIKLGEIWDTSKKSWARARSSY